MHLHIFSPKEIILNATFHTLMIIAHQIYARVWPVLSYCKQILCIQEQPRCRENRYRKAVHCVRMLRWCTFCVSLMNTAHNGYRAAILNLGSTDRGDPWIEFRGSMNLDGKKITTLFSLT